MSNSERDHYDDQEKTTIYNPAYPLSISIAGMICLILGGVIGLGASGYSLSIALRQNLDRYFFGDALIAMVLGGPIAIVGIVLLRGKVQDVIHIAVTSLAFGLVGIGVGMFWIYFHGWKMSNPESFDKVINLGVLLSGSVLMLAVAFLTLKGRKSYIKWRESQSVVSPKRNPFDEF